MAVASCRTEDPAAGLDARISQEVTRVDSMLQRLEKAELPPDLREAPKIYRDSLQRVRSGTTPAVRLYRLRDAYVGAELLSFFDTHKESSRDLAGVQKVWSSREAEILRKAPADRPHILDRALIQAAQNRSEKLFRASLPYAKVSAPFAGMYYLAEAEGNHRFRAFVESLPPGRGTEKSPQRQELQRALQSLETETLNAFAADPAGRGTIPVSAKLKEARELIDANLLDGAALTLLEAQLELSRRSPSTKPATASSPGDSIGEMFAAIAQERAKDETGAAIRASVLPLYSDFYRTTTAQRRGPASVTVTLVRWPYT